jgi:hypothetical protein
MRDGSKRIAMGDIVAILQESDLIMGTGVTGDRSVENKYVKAAKNQPNF